MIKPIRDKVLIKPVRDDGKHTSTALHVSGMADDMLRGEVIDVGTGHLATDGTPVKLAITPGEVVLYRKGTGVAFKSYRKDLVMLREAEIYGTELPDEPAS
jgi:chaperonin GroES